MVEADTLVVWDQFNKEGRIGSAFCARGRTTGGGGRDTERGTTREIQHERERGRERDTMMGEGRETARGGRGTVAQTHRQIGVRMTYVMQYFHFENSFE